MADKDMVDAVKVGLQAHELHLCSFTAVDQERAILYFNKL